MEMVRKHTFLLWVFMYRPGYLSEGMLKKKKEIPGLHGALSPSQWTTCPVVHTPVQPSPESEPVQWPRKHKVILCDFEGEALRNLACISQYIQSFYISAQNSCHNVRGTGHMERPRVRTLVKTEHQVPCEWASVDNQPSWAFRWLLPWSPLDYSNMRDPKLELPSWAQSTHRIMKNNNVPISLKNVLDEPIKN